MKIKLPDSVASPQDIDGLITEIHEYARWFSHESIKVNAGIKQTSDQPILSPPTTEMLQNWQKQNSLSQTSLDSLISSLKEYLTNAPTIAIILAAPVTNSTRDKLVKWCRQNIATNVLVEFSFNSTLLGGLVVRYGSRIFDWSFRSRLLAASNNFTKVLRNV